MAMIYLLEGKTDFGAASSYNTAPDGSGSNGLPVDTDSLTIAFDNYIASNHTALAAIDLVECIITGNITTSGPALSFKVSSGSSAKMTIQTRTGRLPIISASGNIDELIFEPVSGGAELSLESGTFPIVKWLGGKLEQQSAATITAMYRAQASATVGLSGILYDGTTAITTFYNTAGNLEIRRSVTTFHNHTSGASVVVDGDAALATTNNSGYINDRSSATHTTLNNSGGVWNPAGSPSTKNFTTINKFAGSVITQVGSRTMVTASTFNNFTNTPNTETTNYIPPSSPLGR